MTKNQGNLSFSIRFIDSKLSLVYGEIKSFELIESFFDIPKFIMIVNFSSDVLAQIGPAEFILTISSDINAFTFRCTTIHARGNIIQGYVIPKTAYFMRKSRMLSNSLQAALTTLNLKPKIDPITLTSLQPFLQMNETDCECFKRISRYCGINKLVAMSNEAIKLVDLNTKLPKKLTEFDYEHIFEYNSARTYMGILSSEYSIMLAKNLYYKTENVGIPTSCLFSKDAVLSYLEKKKLENWECVNIKQKFPYSIGELGDAFQIPTYKRLNAVFFISKVSKLFEGTGVTYSYIFSSFKGWDAYGV